MQLRATLFSLLVTLTIFSNARAQQIRCRNPNRNYGYCVSIYDCPSLLEIAQTFQLTDAQRMFIRESQCQNGYGRAPYVCCTPDKNYAQPATTSRTPLPASTAPTVPTARSTGNGLGNVLPVPPHCGPISLGDKIYNGNDTALDEYPWMVLIEYRHPSGKHLLDCGGSLINQRYVLTAAHCVKGEIEQQIGKLTSVRLGEYDISSAVDCVLGDCNKPVVELGVERAVVHPQYNPSSDHRHHDIALLRLNEDVSYSDFIQPVCLPLTSEAKRAAPVGEVLTVSGWGRTLFARQSNVKKQLLVPVFDHDECVQKFRTKRINIIPQQICAGGEFAKDSCDGDSGGPLMAQRTANRWHLEGVVSFGHRCGLEGWPGVYTRVADYIDWIRSTLEP